MLHFPSEALPATFSVKGVDYERLQPPSTEEMGQRIFDLFWTGMLSNTYDFFSGISDVYGHNPQYSDVIANQAIVRILHIEWVHADNSEALEVFNGFLQDQLGFKLTPQNCTEVLQVFGGKIITAVGKPVGKLTR